MTKLDKFLFVIVVALVIAIVAVLVVGTVNGGHF